MEANPEDVIGVNSQHIESNSNEFVAATCMKFEGEVRLISCHDIDTDVIAGTRYIEVT